MSSRKSKIIQSMRHQIKTYGYILKTLIEVESNNLLKTYIRFGDHRKFVKKYTNDFLNHPLRYNTSELLHIHGSIKNFVTGKQKFDGSTYVSLLTLAYIANNYNIVAFDGIGLIHRSNSYFRKSPILKKNINITNSNIEASAIKEINITNQKHNIKIHNCVIKRAGCPGWVIGDDLTMDLPINSLDVVEIDTQTNLDDNRPSSIRADLLGIDVFDHKYVKIGCWITTLDIIEKQDFEKITNRKEADIYKEIRNQYLEEVRKHVTV